MDRIICDYDYLVNKMYDYDYDNDYSIFVIDYAYVIRIIRSLAVNTKLLHRKKLL